MNGTWRTIGAIMAMGIWMCCAAWAQETQFGLGFEASYTRIGLGLPDGLVHHATHPDDRVFMAGDAGDTDVASLGLTLLGIHATLSRDRTEDRRRRWECDVAIWFPLTGSAREEKQNENDVRPPEQGSYIYTEVEGGNPIFEVGLGASYRSARDGNWTLLAKPMVYLGYWSLAVEKGWNRFGSDQPSESSDAAGIGLSPQLRVGAENDWIRCELALAYRLLSLDYGAAGSGVSHGAEVGVAVIRDL